MCKNVYTFSETGIECNITKERVMNLSSRRIQVSFKKNSRDSELLDLINSKNDKSNFIKDCIEFYINNNKSTGTKQNKRKIKF